MILSICLPTYNRPEFLSRFLESIRNQKADFSMFEILILNNGSDFKTTNLLNYWKQNLPNLRVINSDKNERGKKPTLSLLETSLGRWIVFPGDDDEFTPGALKLILKTCLHAEQNNFSLLSFGALTQNNSGNLLPKKFNFDKKLDRYELIAKLIFENLFWLPCTVFKKKPILDSNIPNTITCGDQSFWIAALIEGELLVIHEPIIRYTIHELQEQHSYPVDFWNLDRLIAFDDMIQRGALHYLLNESNSDRISLFLNSLNSEISNRRMELVDQYIFIRLCQKIDFKFPSLNKHLIAMLDKTNIHPRIKNLYFDYELTEARFRKAIENLKIDPLYNSMMNRESENLKIDLENQYNLISSAINFNVKYNDVTKFERKILTFYRLIKNFSVVKRLFNR